MSLLGLPNELILQTASYLDDAKDKAAFVETCRRIYELTKSDLHRFLATNDGACDIIINAALTGNTTILDLLYPYNPDFVNRIWLVDINGSEQCHCHRPQCNHQMPRVDSFVNPWMLPRSVFDRIKLAELTFCFEYPQGSFTLLHFAVISNDTAQISWLLNHGADVEHLCEINSCEESKGKNGAPLLTALQIALCNRYEEAAELLIEHGASLDGIVDDPLTPEQLAAEEPRIDYYTPAICLAAAFGLSRTVQLLLRRGIDVNTRDPWGYTAAHYAADYCWEEKYLGVFSLLAVEGADLRDRNNFRLRSPLEMAFVAGSFQVVLQLVQLGGGYDEIETDPDHNDPGMELLPFACAFKCKLRGLLYFQYSCFNSLGQVPNSSSESWEAARDQVVRDLLDLGKDPNRRTNIDHRRCRDANGDTPPRGELHHRGYCNIVLRTNVTALSAAADDCSPDLMALLIHRGAEIDAQDEFGLTPLWQLFICDTSLDDRRGYDVQAPCWRARPEHSWQEPVHRWQEKMELLLRSGAKLDPWADPAAKEGPSDKVLTFVDLLNCDTFWFMVERTTALNMSAENLERLAVVLLAKRLYDKALSIYIYHGPFHLEAHEIKAWREGGMGFVLNPLDPRMGDDVLECVRRHAPSSADHIK